MVAVLFAMARSTRWQAQLDGKLNSMASSTRWHAELDGMLNSMVR
jgi:hypothetical protein